jgi:hypothetical protein
VLGQHFTGRDRSSRRNNRSSSWPGSVTRRRR